MPAQSTPIKATNAAAYRKIRGRIRLVTPAYGQFPTQFAVAHEDVPGYMAAMTMSYPVSQVKGAQLFKNGDKIRFDLVRHGSAYFIENIALLPADTPINIAKM